MFTIEKDKKMNEDLATVFWNEINEIEQLSCKLTNCQSIIIICAERTLSDESGAMWATADMLTDIENKLDERVNNLIQIYKKIKPVKSRIK